MNDDATAERQRILLVEDDAECGDYLTFCLEQEGFEVITATDAEGALKLLDSKKFELIATDMNLPGMDGLEFLQYIRRHFGDIPVIVITGYSSVGSAVDALKHGAQDYLTKPFDDPDRLLTAIRKAMDHHRLTVQNRALQERVDRAERMEYLGNLAGGVAHDLNNILAPMLSLPDILVHSVQDVCDDCKEQLSPVVDDLELMKASARRAVAMVRDLLTSSRRGNYTLKPVEINQVVLGCIESQELSELRRLRPDIEVDSELAPDLPLINGAQSPLVRVVANLVRNGMEAMDERITGSRPTKKILRIRTNRRRLERPLVGYEVIDPAEYILVEVSDTGIGISGDDLQRIFEPFFTRKKESRESGSGLGLSVVHGIIKDHGGFIDVESRVGLGTTFRLYLPTTTQEARSEKPPSELAGGTETVLVVDDEPGPRLVAKRFLARLGYTPTLAQNGHEAVKIMEDEVLRGNRTPFDLVLLDMVMEDDFDGLTTLEAIRELCPDQKAMMISGFAATPRVQSARDMGAGWLPKPYDLQTFAASVRQILDG